MDLILLRHGKSEPHGHPDGDSERALVEKGREQSRLAARILKAAGLLPEIVLTSPLIRARQTADEFCTTAGMPGPVVQRWLATGMEPSQAMDQLAGYRDFGRVAIVGHEPDFSEFLLWVLGALGGTMDMKKGAIACLRIQPPSRHGTLLFLLPPNLSGGI